MVQFACVCHSTLDVRNAVRHCCINTFKCSSPSLEINTFSLWTCQKLKMGEIQYGSQTAIDETDVMCCIFILSALKMHQFWKPSVLNADCPWQNTPHTYSMDEWSVRTLYEYLMEEMSKWTYETVIDGCLLHVWIYVIKTNKQKRTSTIFVNIYTIHVFAVFCCWHVKGTAVHWERKHHTL